MTHPIRLALLLLGLCPSLGAAPHLDAAVPSAAAPAAELVAAEDPAPPDAAALFMAHCASCHGETGDGKGWTELDRPARSFKDGGFSFGNTPETIARTISGGIPGTPMPGFDAALGEAERASLARYVISLGPPELPAPKNTELIVRERPLVVRGMLPPIARGAPERPRGLLVGTLDGLTFEYDAADVRLLGVRQGRFVDRRDWGDRGGSALQPLGQVVHLVENGRPRAPFALRTSAGQPARPLAARLGGTRALGGQAALLTVLRAEDGRVVARVEERPRGLATGDASGFLRAFVIEPLEAAELVLHFPWLDAPLNEAERFEAAAGERELLALRPRVGGQAALVGLRVPRGTSGALTWLEDGSGLALRVQAGLRLELDQVVLPLVPSDPTRFLELLHEVCR